MLGFLEWKGPRDIGFAPPPCPSQVADVNEYERAPLSLAFWLGLASGRNEQEIRT